MKDPSRWMLTGEEWLRKQSRIPHLRWYLLVLGICLILIAAKLLS